MQGAGAQRLSVESSTASVNAADGVRLNNSSAVVSVSNSAAIGNTSAGFRNTAGTFESRGNNTVRHNAGGNTAGTITAITGT